jgi:hypothetical protein
LPTDRQYLFVIDEAKALRAAIDEVFGSERHVQHWCNHKLRNVLGGLSNEQQGQTLNLLRAAWKVSTPEEGEKRSEPATAHSSTDDPLTPELDAGRVEPEPRTGSDQGPQNKTIYRQADKSAGAIPRREVQIIDRQAGYGSQEHPIKR